MLPKIIFNVALTKMLLADIGAKKIDIYIYASEFCES